MFKINPIQPEQVSAAKRVIYRVAQAIFFDQVPLEEGITIREARGELRDMDDIQQNYFENGGTFLVLMDEYQVIGTGALRQLEETVCELKRLWLLPEYHGRGLGYRMLQELMAIARAKGYQTIRLETDATRQTQAIAFYQRQGFYEIPRYGDDPDELAMERAL
jgi:putative acetyltransferase